LAIQENEDVHDDVKIAYMPHNMDNLETDSGRYNEAIEYFTKTVAICSAYGDSAAGQLALTCLCMGRLFYFRENYDKAIKCLASSEALFVRTFGAKIHSLAFVHFTYGNIEFALEHWRIAKRFYGDALKIAIATTPIHLITSAIYCRLGCVELALRNHNVAKSVYCAPEPFCFHLEY